MGAVQCNEELKEFSMIHHTSALHSASTNQHITLTHNTAITSTHQHTTLDANTARRHVNTIINTRTPQHINRVINTSASCQYQHTHTPQHISTTQGRRRVQCRKRRFTAPKGRRACHKPQNCFFFLTFNPWIVFLICKMLTPEESYLPVLIRDLRSRKSLGFENHFALTLRHWTVWSGR